MGKIIVTTSEIVLKIGWDGIRIPPSPVPGTNLRFDNHDLESLAMIINRTGKKKVIYSVHILFTLLKYAWIQRTPK